MVKSNKENEKAFSVLHEVKPMKFRVPITITPSWKMKAISEHKKKEYQKQINNNTTNNSINTNNISGNKSENSAGISIISNQNMKFNVPDDHIKRELDNLTKNSQSIRKEMLALANIRMSLLWLLKKTNIHETMRNHTHT